MKFELPTGKGMWINDHIFPFRLFPKIIMNWDKQKVKLFQRGGLPGMWGDGLLGNNIPINYHKEISFLWWLFVIEY